MNGIDFSSIAQAITQLINQVAAIINFLNLTVAIVGLTATEIAKKFLPDAWEDKWVMLIGVVVCGLITLVPKFNCDIVTGIITGCFIVGGYSILFKFVKMVIQGLLDFKNGNGKTKEEVKPE